MEKEKKKFSFLRFLLHIVAFILFIWLAGGAINYACNLMLRDYIESFDVVDYPEDRLVPEIGEEGHYTITTDRDLKIMHITDVHVGGGMFSFKRDKKTIYEVITMLQKEKPDLVILGGDNTYPLFTPGYNGGWTFNNKMVAKTVIDIFEHEQVYFSTVFGNHDTEAIDYYSRQDIGDLYMSEDYKYSIFREEYTDPDADTVPSVSNQFILVKNSAGKITKVLLLIDSNAYIDTTPISSAKMLYDTIHPAQIEWARSEIENLSLKQGLPEGEYLKCITFMHIPVGEYRTAYEELFTDVMGEEGKPVAFEQKDDPKDTVFVSGYWDEDKIYFGGISNTDIAPEDQDLFFEVMAEEMGSVEAIFCGHDHVNNGVVYYKGVMLAYGYSVDNIAYGNEISNVGSQRGATVITVSPDGTFSEVHKNAYKDYGCETDKFVPVDPDGIFTPGLYRTYE